MLQSNQLVQPQKLRDSVIGDHPDRQVLVVGDTIIGHTLTLLLHHAGFDPLLGTASDRARESEIAYLWPAVVRTLECIDINLSTLAYSTAVDSISVRNTDASTENATAVPRFDQANGEPPMVVPTDELGRVLSGLSAERARTIDQRIETLTTRNDGTVIEFANGIREWFDIVLYADRPETARRSRGSESVATTSLTQYEIGISEDQLQWEEPRCIDIWDSDTHIQFVPRQTSEWLVRATSSRGTTTGSISRKIGEQLRTDEETKLDANLTETTASTVRQTALQDQYIDAGWWADGRVGRCGQAVCAMVPASGFGLSFGIEDAFAFVTELVRSDRSVTDVVTAYANRREQRLRTLLRTARLAGPDHAYLDLISSDTQLETVGLLRSISLAPLVGDNVPSI